MDIQLSDHFSYKKLLRFTLPSIGMMVFTSVYGVVDGYFVSNYTGNIPFASINLTMPFLMFFSAIGFMIGSGGTALIAFYLGIGDKKRANAVFSLLTYVVIIIGIIVTIGGEIGLSKVAVLLGATDEMHPYCVSYGRIILIALVPFMLQNMFQSFLIVAEKPQLGFAITVLAGVTNIIGDYIFVAKLSMGVNGAAFATALSQCVGGIVPLIYLSLPNSSLLKLGRADRSVSSLIKAAGNGASEFVTNISLSVVSMIYNFQLMKYAGESGVSAYGVIMYVSFIFIAVFIGYSMGVAPVVGFNYGAGNHSELKNVYGKSKNIIFVTCLGMFILSEILSTPLAKLYVGYDDNLMKLTENAFRIYSVSFLIVGINIFSSAFFTALNNGKVSAIISFTRTFAFQVIIVMVLPLIFGINGIWWATAVAETLALFISVCFLVRLKNGYGY